tara:strand:+ start:8254 stop:8427 length:174 start_codon:yes stop_codon:yes gene_type:complete
LVKRAWRLWARHLGEKVCENDNEADIVAAIRTFWWLLHVAACFMIIIHNGAKLGWWL